MLPRGFPRILNGVDIGRRLTRIGVSLGTVGTALETDNRTALVGACGIVGPADAWKLAASVMIAARAATLHAIVFFLMRFSMHSEGSHWMGID